jgi:uncharacterized repeat protein (TIGR02543 family)
MKRRFTILTAALALLAFLAIPMGMMGQTRETYTVTYDVTDLGDMFEDGSSYASANGYWKVPASAGESALISIPITQQPTSDISVKFHIATFGSGNNPAATNTTITAVGTESNSNWSGSGVSSYPSSSTYVDGVMTITKPNNPTTLSGLEITMGVASGVKIFRLQSITVEYTYGGGTPTPTTYTVTYDCNGGTSGCPENVTDLEAGDEITLADGPVKTDYDFAGWSDGNTTYDEGDTYTVNGNVTFTAQWTEQVSGEVHWVLTDLADLTTSDVFVIVGNNGSNYAMKNSGASNSGPVVVAVTVSGSELTGTIGDDIRWNISGDATNGYIFYPNGSSTTWLYCIDNNNGLRIGSGNTDYNTFVIQNNYIYNTERQRYVGIFNSQDWRSYTSINNNIKNQTFAFYKKVTGDVLPPSITANNVSFDYNTTSGEIEYTINNSVENATLIANTNGSWLTLGTVGSTSIPFTCSTNVETTARTATVTLSYVNGEATLATKEMTVTQGAAPISYTTIPDLFAAATSTETPVYVTFNDWVVSGISTNGKNVFVTDNDGNGFVIYGTNMSDIYTVGDILSGTAVSCTLKKYNGFAELLNVDANDLTITTGGTITVANVDMADLAGVNTGALVHYEGLTCNITTNTAGTTYYYLSDGTTTLQVYNSLYTFDALVEGKTYNITGVYQQYNSTKEILPRSADDIEEVVMPSITIEPDTLNVNAEQHLVNYLSLTYENIEVENTQSFTVHYYDAEGEEIEPVQGEAWMVAGVVKPNDVYQVVCTIIANEGEARTGYFKVSAQDADDNTVYSNLVTVNQAGAPQQYTLTVEPFENLELITFVNDEMVMEGDGAIQVTEGDQIMLSIVADEGYVMQTLMVNNVNHVNDIADDFTYTFDMPAENVTISATAVENVAPAGGNYVRITSLNQLTDGSKVIIAARYDEEHTNGYFAMPGQTTSRPYGVAFTSETSGNDEILPATITSSEDTYYWTVNVTENGYTFTNANNQMIGWTNSTSFATGGNNTTWTISRETAAETAMVAEYTGFVITNLESSDRAFAFNGERFGAYSKSSNLNGSGYNFFLDFFVQSNEPATETYTLHINGYTSAANGWNLIASPVATTPAQVTNMLTEETSAPYSYDLYRFNQSNADGKEWENYQQHQDDFSIVPGQGYLYANSGTVDLVFSGDLYDGNGEITMENAGWNLMGNPFYNTAANIGRDYYRMNSTNDGLIPGTANENINAWEGIFVEAAEANETVTFSPATTGEKSTNSAMVINLSQNSVIDRAIVRFGGNSMTKFQLFENSTKLYIAQNGEDYAIVNSDKEGEMPVNFKAEKNGTYTISVNTENVSMDYLHLIDNMTGNDIDLLANPSYTFNAQTTDYASRFRLVFAAGNANEESFVYFNGSEWVVNGNGTMQLVDMTGRVLSSENVNGVVTVNINKLSAGVYVMRLVNGNDVKTQKIVVK